jgi:signal transduction histidine kinase
LVRLRGLSRVELADGELTITVRNDAVAEASAIAHTGSGLGLAGMRERLAALDGDLTAGPNADGGFCLCARLPLDQGAGSGDDAAAREADPRQAATRSATTSNSST